MALEMDRKSFLGVLMLSMTSLFATPVAADNYPSKPITIIVPFAPGGTVDAVARTVGERLSQALKQPVIIDNRGGAGGTIGTAIAATAKPDGYTLLMVFDTHATNQHLYRKLPYKTEQAFAPVSLLVRNPQLLVAHPKVPATNVTELVASQKSNKTPISYASVGPGSSNHLTAELFRDAAGIEMTHVPYKGGGPAINDLLGGHVDVMFVSLALVAQHVKGGKLKPLAVTSSSRHPLFPDVPTIAEQGFPGFEAQSWVGILAPAGTPKDIVARLNQELSRSLSQPDVKEKLQAQGHEIVGSAPEQFGEWIQAESAKWGKVIKERNITLD
jgi:tripartite-type tricarboxylate transporter receptor subunit TctC